MILGTTGGSAADTDVDNAANTLVVSGVVAGTGAVTQNVGVGTSIAGTYGHLTLSSDGHYSYVADTADSLAAGVTAVDTFTYTDKDPAGAVSNSTTLKITVTGGNDAPINLGLSDPSADHVGAVTLTIAGVPSGLTLSRGHDNGDGTWTVQTNDIAALSITSPGDYTGALVLNVAESWTNADGSTGNAIVADNVEVFAKGAPIFAMSGDDTLTGSSGDDLFVFAQPIGNDIVHNFDAAHDTIDLIGYGFASFADVQAHLANDAAGNAVLTLGAGETITLHGVDAATLTAGDFVFNQDARHSTMPAP